MTAFWLNVVWMMAAQLYWEKDQGNLELYFAAPDERDERAARDGRRRPGHELDPGGRDPVHRDGRVRGDASASSQWALLIAVFLLTLAALYGLGMMLASLFLMWGREAFHLTQLMIEPVYFVSGLNFPVGRLGVLGALAIALIPLAVGLDAMRQLAFASTGPTGTPAARIEALILVAMTVVFIGLARWLLHSIEERARREGR